MRSLHRVTVFAVYALAASTVGACSTSGTNVPAAPSAPFAAKIVVAGRAIPASAIRSSVPRNKPLTRQDGIGAAKGAETLYLSLAEGSVYNGYRPPKHKVFCSSAPQLSNIVNSIGVDSTGTMWLPTAIVGQPSQVNGYAPGCGALQSTLSLPPNADPSGIAFGADGTKYVLNSFIGDSGYDSASVSIYAPGATAPTGTLTDTRLNGEDFIADGIGSDAAGNVYVTCCAEAGAAFAIRFAGSGDQTSGTQISLTQMLAPGGAVVFDKAQNMIVPDAGDATLKVYAPPYTGAPSSTTPLRGRPWQCALSKNQKKIACANFEKSSADVYAYPSMNPLYHLKASNFPSVPALGLAYYP